MPRRKPDQTIVHRIEMGTWERSNLEPLILSSTIENYVRPVALLGIGAGALYGSYQLARFVSGLNEVPDKIEQWFIAKAATVGKGAGDAASTVIDPTGSMKEKHGVTFGEKIEIATHWFFVRMGLKKGSND